MTKPKAPADPKGLWPATKTYTRRVDKLTPNPRNSRTHSDEQVDQIVGLIKEFGWTNPILVDENDMILAGHGRLEAAKRMGLTSVPVVVAKGWTEKQKRAYVIADNQSAMNAGWDMDVLSAELSALGEMDFSMDLLGFGDDELGEILGTGTKEGETDADEIPEPEETPVTRAGDVWLMGAHRLTCGDSTDPEAVSRVLGPDKPHLMVTDPPYGVKYDADWRNHTGDIGRSARAVGKVANDDRADWREAWALFPGDVAYVWHAGNMGHIVAESLIATELKIRSQIIWNKNQLVIGRGDYHPKHEPCWYAVREGRKGHYQGDRKQTTVWDIDKPRKSETGHSTQKPVECMERPIRNNSKAGDFVYEPFSGSGTLIIAAERTGRIALALELNPTYVDMAVRRWQNFTGKQAIRQDGVLFDELRSERDA